MPTVIDDFAPSPLSFLRTPLFAAAERSKATLKRELLSASTNCGIKLTYTGPRLNQTHAVVWQALVRELRRQRAHVTHRAVVVHKADLLRATGHKDTSTSSRDWLWSKLQDLQTALVEVETERHRYSGQLVGRIIQDKQTKLFHIEVDDELAVMLTDDFANVDLDRKLSFGRHQLACWLHDFLSTQSNTRRFPFPVAGLREWSGSPLAMPQFKQKLKEAVMLLKGGERPLLIDGRITGDMFVWEKNPTNVVRLPVHTAPKTAALTAEAQRVNAALERRGRVAL